MTRYLIPHILLLTLTGSCFAEEEKDVKDAVKRVFVACEEGDEKAVLAATLPMTPDHLADLRVLLRESRAQIIMDRLLIKLFGDDARKSWPNDPDADIAEESRTIDAGKVTLNSKDDATLSYGVDPKELLSIHCTKVAGAWYAALPSGYNTAHLHVKPAPTLPSREEIAIYGTRRCEAFTIRLQNGEFKNATDARNAFERRTTP